MSAREIDRGASAFVLGLQRLREVKLTVGVHEDDGERKHPSGGTVIGAAAALELGTEEHAPIGWLRTTMDGKRRSLGGQLARAAADVVKGQGVVEAFGPVVAKLATAMRAKIPVHTGTTRHAVTARVNGEVVG